jgi:hypothetical protein
LLDFESKRESRFSKNHDRRMQRCRSYGQAEQASQIYDRHRRSGEIHKTVERRWQSGWSRKLGSRKHFLNVGQRKRVTLIGHSGQNKLPPLSDDVIAGFRRPNGGGAFRAVQEVVFGRNHRLSTE